ncbi:hypothetical protein ACS0PU_004063 [Formica fusca]
MRSTFYIILPLRIIWVSITRTCLPTGGETRRPGGGSLVTGVRRLKGTRTRVAPTAKKSLGRDGIRDSESRLARLKV